MSKLLTFLFFFLLIGLIAGFIYLAIIDVPVEQNMVSEETTLGDLKASIDE